MSLMQINVKNLKVKCEQVHLGAFSENLIAKKVMETERRNIERPVDGRMTLVLGLFDLTFDFFDDTKNLKN